jgi:hypothetical protein
VKLQGLHNRCSEEDQEDGKKKEKERGRRMDGSRRRMRGRKKGITQNGKKNDEEGED